MLNAECLSVCVEKLQVRVDFTPLFDSRNDVEGYQLVPHLAEMLVACIELGDFLRSSLRHLVGASVLVEHGVHGHHDVVVLVGLHVCSSWVFESLSTHDRADHLHREVRRALERAAPTEFDDGSTTLGDSSLHVFPLLLRELLSTDEFGERFAVDLDVASS